MVVEAVKIEQPALVISSEPIMSMIAHQLQQHGIDVTDLERQNRLQMLDAEWLLTQVMLGGLPDPNRFSARILPLLQKVCAGRDPCIPVIYSDMSDRLRRATRRPLSASKFCGTGSPRCTGFH